MSGLSPSLWGGSDNSGIPLQHGIDKVFNEFSRYFGLPSHAPNE